MDREQLVKSANELKSVSNSSSKEYSDKIAIIVSRTDELLMARDDLDKLVGSNNLSMMKDNHANHARFISTIIANHNSEVLVDTILWVFNAYQNHGFASNYWAAQLNTWITVIKESLSQESFDEIYPLYLWMQVNIPSFVEVSKQIVNNPHE